MQNAHPVRAKQWQLIILYARGWLKQIVMLRYNGYKLKLHAKLVCFTRTVSATNFPKIFVYKTWNNVHEENFAEDNDIVKLSYVLVKQQEKTHCETVKLVRVQQQEKAEHSLQYYFSIVAQ